MRRDIFNEITKDFLSRKANSPLRLQPDYGERQSEFDKESRFHEGPKGRKEWEEWMEDQPQDFQEEWESNTEEYGDKFKRQAKESYLWDDHISGQMKHSSDIDITEKVCGKIKARAQGLGKKANYELLSDHEDSGSYMSRQNLRHIDDMADFLVDDIQGEELDDWVEDKISHAHAALDDVARYRGYRDNFPHEELPNKKFAASGNYGFPKAVQNDVDVAIRKLEAKVDTIIKVLEQRHPEVGSYFANRTCNASKALGQACVFNHTPKRLLKGPLGYKPSCAKAAHKAITDLTLYAGEVAHGLYGKSRDHIPYLQTHSKKKRCPFARLILENYPIEH